MKAEPSRVEQDAGAGARAHGEPLPPGIRVLLEVSALAPYRVLGVPLGRFVVERNLLVWRNMWPALLSGVFEPVLFLLVLGVGVGSLVDPAVIPGASYGEFVAAGLLGAAAMNATVYETYNVYFKLRHDGIYDAMGATPARPRDIAAGEIVWAVSRVLLYAVGFMAVAAALGLLASPLALLAVPIALLVGFAFGSATLAATTFMRSWNDFDLLQIAIVLASISLITGGGVLLGLSFTLTLIAAFFTANGYGLYYDIPSDPEGMIKAIGIKYQELTF